MTFEAAISQNTTGAPRKFNPNNLDAIVDVPLKNGQWVEMTGREAISVFNKTSSSALTRAERRSLLAGEIKASVPNVIGSLSYWEVRENLIALLRKAMPKASTARLDQVADRHIAGHLLKNDKADENGTMIISPLVLLANGTLVTAETINCSRCGGNPHAEYRDFYQNAYDYQSGQRIASPDQEYRCDECTSK